MAMEAAYNKYKRFLNQQSALGVPVQPWQEEAFWKGAIGAELENKRAELPYTMEKEKIASQERMFEKELEMKEGAQKAAPLMTLGSTVANMGGTLGVGYLGKQMGWWGNKAGEEGAKKATETVAGKTAPPGGAPTTSSAPQAPVSGATPQGGIAAIAPVPPASGGPYVGGFSGTMGSGQAPVSQSLWDPTMSSVADVPTGGVESFVQAGTGSAPTSVSAGAGGIEGMSASVLPDAGAVVAENVEATLADLGGSVVGGESGSILGSIAPFLGPAGFGWAAGKLAGQTVGSILPFGGKKEKGALGGAASGAAAGAAAGTWIFPGVGTGIGAVIGAVAGAVSNLVEDCIIVTCCKGRDSKEVQVAREFRDRFMTKEQIRGYYMFAETLVPVLERNKDMKDFFTANLVEPLIEYGKWKTGQTDVEPSFDAIELTRTFLESCRELGESVDSYTRKTTGEVY